MKFGTFVLQGSPSAEADSAAIDRTLDQAVLAEEIGLDAVWLAEHHFSGDCSFADPLVFGTAVAMRTSRIRIGFAVIQMALHHPVRLAIQTALLDNLSHGRLIVGTGRGSTQNAWEYRGFGTTIAEGPERLAEAEDLLLRAWTQDEVEFHGKFWDVTFPKIQPSPYQKPHPPLVRGVVSAESAEAMGRAGRPILLNFGSLDTITARLRTYEDALRAAGHADSHVEYALEQSWVLRSLYVAESRQQALDEATVGFGADVAQLQESWDRIMGTPRKYGLILQPENLIVGTPDDVAERIAELRAAGVRNLLFSMTPGGLPAEKVAGSMRAFAERVAPLFRSANHPTEVRA